MIIFSDNIGIFCLSLQGTKKKFKRIFMQWLRSLDNSMFRIFYQKFDFVFLKIKDNFRKLKVFEEYFFVYN